MQPKNILIALASVILFSFFFGASISSAQASTPYVKTFKITGYYSPLPGQQRYSTGAYDTDITLNGRGIAGADGTPVYYGMVAAPYTYAYGTKLFIPGIGNCAVHDRGGAIVTSYETGSYDRLDIWMGYGDEGLDRALRWGMRTVDVTVYGIDESIKESVGFANYPQSKEAYKPIKTWSPAKDTDVLALQNDLNILGYLEPQEDGNFTQKYDERTKDAVLNFQMDFEIIQSKNDFGAGFYGPRTNMKMIEVKSKREVEILTSLPKVNLGKDADQNEVKKLQYCLKLLGYLEQITENYDNKTIEAVFTLQKQFGIVNAETDQGAGYFGPETLARLEALMLKLPGIPDVLLKEQSIFAQAENVNQPEDIYFTQTLEQGDSNDEVKRLQEELNKLNFLNVEPTGYFGDLTKHALTKLQQSLGIIKNMNEPGAGVFGPQTKDILNKIVNQRNAVLHGAANR